MYVLGLLLAALAAWIEMLGTQGLEETGRTASTEVSHVAMLHVDTR